MFIFDDFHEQIIQKNSYGEINQVLLLDYLHSNTITNVWRIYSSMCTSSPNDICSFLQIKAENSINFHIGIKPYNFDLNIKGFSEEDYNLRIV